MKKGTQMRNCPCNTRVGWYVHNAQQRYGRAYDVVIEEDALTIHEEVDDVDAETIYEEVDDLSHFKVGRWLPDETLKRIKSAN